MTTSESDRAATIWEWIAVGRTVNFGLRVRLDQESLSVGDAQIPLDTLRPLFLDDQGTIVVQQIGAEKPLLTVPPSTVDDAGLLIRVVNRLVQEIPPTQRRSMTGWPPGSVGDVSARIGYDVRDLWMMGYSDDQIDSVLHGRCTVDELLKLPPAKGAQTDP